MAGGTAYIVNGALVDLASKYMPGVTFIAEGTTGVFEGMMLMEDMAKSGRAALSVFAADGVYMGRLGLGLYDPPLTEIYHTCFIFANEIWLTTPVKSGIKSIGDVVGKRIGVGGVGSAISVLAQAYLESYGLTLDDFRHSYVTYEGANAGMQDGSLEGGFYGGPPPFAVYEEMASSMDITAIGVPRDKADWILEKYPYYLESLLPAGIMAGVEEDTIVLALSNNLNMNSCVSDELAYAILEMVFDNLEEFQSYAPRALRDMTLENWSNTVCSDMHPGAIKFFQDMGVYGR